MDFWASRVHSANHLSAAQSTRLLHHFDNHLIMDNTDGDEDVRAWFPCPFCYVEIEVPVLCSHLQEEHCFGLKNAVCPICAANLGKDAIGHFTSQHAHSVKRRRKSQKSGFWSNIPGIPRELSSFIGSNSVHSRGDMHEAAPDSLLSPFLCNSPLSDPKFDQNDQLSCEDTSTTSDMTSLEPSTFEEVQEADHEERRHRAAFVQQLIISTIF